MSAHSLNKQSAGDIIRDQADRGNNIFDQPGFLYRVIFSFTEKKPGFKNL